VRTLDNLASRQFQRGAHLLRQGRLQEAEPLFRAVLARYPALAQACTTLGALLGALGRPHEAEPYLRQALLSQPASADAHGNLGNLLRDLGRLPEAEDCLRQAIRFRPHYPEAYNNLGAVLRDRSDLDGAEASFRRALEQKPDFVLSRTNLARLLLQRNRLPEAEQQFRLIRAGGSASPDALGGLGESLRRQGRYEEAEPVLREALRQRADMPAIWVELGNGLVAAGRAPEAVPCFQAARQLAPRMAEAPLGLGVAAAAEGRYEAAQQHVRAALALDPDLSAAHNALGDILRNSRQFAAAEDSFRTALQLSPDLAEAQVNLAFTLLQTGRQAEGWAAYEHRWRAVPWVHQPRSYPGRPWQGEPLAGQTILLHTEQGLGDSLQFVRYAALFPRGTRVVLQVQRPLVRLLRRLPGPVAVCGPDDAVPPVDWHCSLLSLPHRFGNQQLPAPPYLTAEPAAVAQWRRRLAQGAGLKVGLAWAGSAGMAADSRRSIALRQLEPLAGITGVSFISLQRGPAADQATALPLQRPMMQGDGFEDTAALTMALDLVITVDTSVVHLAGGLGKPVWLLNRDDSCWRWQDGRDDSPWYPTLRQFRQSSPGDWADVVRRVKLAIQEWRDARIQHDFGALGRSAKNVCFSKDIEPARLTNSLPSGEVGP
jgi:tetratricopeptide (TPR) repeat protein